jgi:hypothetical protein
LQQRQGEAGGLAGAGLRRAEQIAPGEDDRDGLRLDGGGFGVTLLGNSAGELGRQAEIFEGANKYLLSDRPGKDSPSKPVQADAILGWVIRRSRMDRETTETLTGQRETETLLRIIQGTGAAVSAPLRSGEGRG